MRMLQLIILILALSGCECRYRILKDPPDRVNEAESLAESAVLSLLSCYEKKMDTVGGIGITDPTLVNTLMTKQPLPVKLFRADELTITGVPDKIGNRTTWHKLNLFVVETSSDQQFEQSLSKAVKSQKSANLATFLIIDWPSQKNQKGCSEALNYLWRMWTFSALNAFYVCVDELEHRVLVYTYNPYTSKAPASWNLNNTIKGYYDHPWSLFVQEYRPDNQRICDNLDFVKTHDLGGYKIRCFYYTNLPFSQLTKQHAEQVLASNTGNMVIARYAMKALNATPDVYLVGKWNKRYMAGNFRENMNITEEQIPGYIDIVLQMMTSIHATEYKSSISFMNMDFVVVTHHAGEKSQLEKLIGVFDRRTRLGICLVIIGTLLFFKFCLGQPLGAAAMNVVRLIGNTGLLRVPDRNPPRLYLAAVFILIVTIIGVYQGLLASLLTKPTPLPDIDTLEDLANSDHQIHVLDLVLSQFFTDARFTGRIVTLRGICESIDGEEMLVRPLDACVLPRVNAIEHAIVSNLHITRDTMIPAYAFYRINENWAIEERFNEILGLFLASRVTWDIYERDLERKIKIAEYKEDVERDRPVVMKLGDIGFAFAFLGMGLSLATIVLAIEIAMKRRQLGRRKTRLAKHRRVINVKEKENIIPTVPCVPGPSSVP